MMLVRTVKITRKRNNVKSPGVVRILCVEMSGQHLCGKSVG